MKTTVIYHSADFDGIFCREIAKKFLADAEFIGWDFADKPLPVTEGNIYVLDLPVDRVFGFDFSLMVSRPGSPARLFEDAALSRFTWIDHHKSSIETHPGDIPGYRIDGVAACRLTWNWFAGGHSQNGERYPLAAKEEYVHRKLNEPLAVRLAGEYDIWDKRDPNAELFQHGLRSQVLDGNLWRWMLGTDCDPSMMTSSVEALLKQGACLQFAKTNENESVIKRLGFDVEFEGLKFLACNHALFNSHLFTAGIKPEHDALLGFKYDGKQYHVSLYHAPGKEHHDLSLIAVKHGGGGHRGACGFRAEKLPFIN